MSTLPKPLSLVRVSLALLPQGRRGSSALVGVVSWEPSAFAAVWPASVAVSVNLRLDLEGLGLAGRGQAGKGESVSPAHLGPPRLHSLASLAPLSHRFYLAGVAFLEHHGF